MIRRHGPDAAGVDPVPPATVRVPAPAKVNLFLEVLGKRADGYHEIATLMLAIDLADELDFAPDESGELSLTCDDPALADGPGQPGAEGRSAASRRRRGAPPGPGST